MRGTIQSIPRVKLVEVSAQLVAHVRQHMGMEESILIPGAARALSQSDWEQIEKAFLENGDPRFGAENDEEFRLRFGRIVSLFPKAQLLI